MQLPLFSPTNKWKCQTTKTSKYRFGDMGDWAIHLLVINGPPLSKVYGFKLLGIYEKRYAISFSHAMPWSSPICVISRLVLCLFSFLPFIHFSPGFTREDYALHFLIDSLNASMNQSRARPCKNIWLKKMFPKRAK